MFPRVFKALSSVSEASEGGCPVSKCVPVQQEESRWSGVQHWLRLLRVPNLATAFGDPVAGFLLAHNVSVPIWPHVLIAALISVCFYMAGMIWNDVADVEEDREERPHRPLPAGAIAVHQASVVAAGLMAMGLLFSALLGMQTFWVALCLCVLIFTYNFIIKQVPLLGALSMGGCRALSVLVGASAGRETASMGSPAWIVAGLLLIYVAAVTQLARKETSPIPPTAEAWLPLGALALGLTLVTQTHAFEGLAVLRRLGLMLPNVVACGICFYVGIRVTRRGHFSDPGQEIIEQEELLRELPDLMGWLISALIFIQMAFILAAGQGLTSVLFALLLLAGWIGNRFGVRGYYAS